MGVEFRFGMRKFQRWIMVMVACNMNGLSITEMNLKCLK